MNATLAAYGRSIARARRPSSVLLGRIARTAAVAAALTQPSQSSGPPGADSSIAPLPGSVHYSDPDNLATQAHFSSSRPPERKEPKCAPPHMHS